MESIDEKIAAKKARDKKKKSKKKRRHSHADDESDLDASGRSFSSSKHSSKKQSADAPQDMDDIIAARRKERRMHNLASSGLPKQPPEIQYNLNPPKKEKKKKKKYTGELKSPPEELIAEAAAAASVPGVQFERVEDTSEAERLKYGHLKPAAASIDTSVASMPAPGVRQESSEDLTPAERTKFGYSKKASTESAASMPGVRQKSSEDLTPAERTKFGYNKKASTESVASMPGARQQSSEDLTPAERTKFGYNKKASTESVASMPGAKMESVHDVSEAERLKYGHRNNTNTSISNTYAASKPGAMQERTHDVSEAERLKYGQNSRQTIGAIAATQDDIDAAARLKFSGGVGNDHARNASPGVTQANNANTSEAERIKFGLVQQFAGGNQSNDSSVSSNNVREEDEVEEDINDDEEEEYHDNAADIENNHHEEPRPPRRTRAPRISRMSLRSSWQSSQQESRRRRRSVRESHLSFMSGASFDDEDINPDGSSEKRRVDIWKPCCQICTSISFIIIIALSASLGAANKKVASYSLVETSIPAEASIVVTPMPSLSPSLSPTTAPEDYSFCYTQNEFAVMNRPSYSSLRSELISSGLSTSNEFSDTNSYQRKALCWLAFGDRLNLTASDPFLEQRYALSTVFFALNESTSLLESGWLSGLSECQWEPVECDSRTDSTITKLFLASSELVGELPKELRYLQDITDLDVRANRLEGDIINAIGSWSNLMSLKLETNNFVSIPDLSLFPLLNHLDMKNNQISGPIPDSLAYSTNLAHLDLSINSFDGTIPTILGELKSLKELYFHSNDLRGSMPAEICALRDVDLRELSTDCDPTQKEVECNVLTCCTQCGEKEGFARPSG